MTAAGNVAEPNYNQVLAEQLSRRLPRWTVSSQATGLLQNSQQQPDVYVQLPSGLPVILECKYNSPISNVAGVEKAAQGRLGQVAQTTGQQVEQSVAVLYPERLKSEAGSLGQALESAQLSYAAFLGTQSDFVRFPELGWLEGNLDDLADFIENVAVSEQKIQRALEHFANSVNAAANRLTSIQPSPEATLRKLGRVLHQEPGEQTTRMAVAILLNAMVFHSTVAANHAEVGSISQLAAKARQKGRSVSQNDVLEIWDYILTDIDYWPIFAIARDVLCSIDDETAAAAMLQSLAESAEQLAQLTAQTVQDLAGQIFGRLISDRKFLATFYTLPASAAFLAELAISRLDVDWDAADAVRSLKIADFACGTGALLSAAYRQVAQRARRRGIDEVWLHRKMMEEMLIGTDIMPAAVHITTSMLSSVHPEIEYTSTRTHVMPYGAQPDGSIKIGSLHLLKADEMDTLWGDGTRAVTGEGEDTTAHLSVAHGEVDLVIMNPPFTRSTKHDAEAAGVPVPSFAGFGTSEEEQKEMAAILKELYRNGAVRKAGHGNAGLASNFIDLAIAKAKPGGVVALVLPATFASGNSWRNARELIAKKCADVCVISIAADGTAKQSFSADTALGEVLVIATRRDDSETGDSHSTEKWRWVNLRSRPQSPAAAIETAKSINAATEGEFLVGTSKIGLAIESPFGNSLEQIGSFDLARLALQIEQGKHLRLALHPSAKQAVVELCPLGKIGDSGTYHLDIIGKYTSDGSPRGPFDKRPKPEWKVFYPMLWAHDHIRETKLIVAPDSEGRIREGMAKQAQKLWEHATRLHFSLDFGFASQPLAACLTEEKCIGGTAWPSYLLHEKAMAASDDTGVVSTEIPSSTQETSPTQQETPLTPQEKMEWVYPVVLWSNTTLGLLIRWLHGSRQQIGRSRTTISRLPELKVLDPRALSSKQLLAAETIFNQFKDREFLPANEAYRDQIRIELDEAIFVGMLAQPVEILDWLAVIRDQWCREPTVHGGKTTKP